MPSTQCFVKLLYLSILYVVTISKVCSYEDGDTNNTITESPASTTALDTATLDDENTTSTIESTTVISTQPSTSSVTTQSTTEDQSTAEISTQPSTSSATTQSTGDQSTTEISTQPSTSSATTQSTGDQSTTEISTQPSTSSATTQSTGDQSTTEAMEATTEETTTSSNEEISPDNTTSLSQNTSESSTESPTKATTEKLMESTSATEIITTSSSDITTSDAPVPTSTQETDNATSAPDTSSPQTSDSNLTTEVPSSITVATTQQSTASTSSNDVTTEATTDVATTQPHIITTKQTYQVEPIYPSIENAVLELKFVLKFNGCSHNKTTIESKLSSVSSSINGCEYLRVRRIKSCSNGRRKRSASGSQVSVDAALGIDAQVGISSGSNVSHEMYASLSTVKDIDLTYLNDSISNVTNTLTSQSICDSDSCRGALIGRPGFVCVDQTLNNKQRCAILYYCDHHPIDCGKHGQCYVETDSRSTSYVSKCRCNKEDYFRYEGVGCTEKVLTWELAIIICASAGGVLILVLLCVIVTLCFRNASNSADVSFEESELIYSPSGITSTSHYKNGVENRGYMEVRETSASGSWKPEDSANTYANIDSKLRESNYNIQIKRPKVSQVQRSDEITEF
ncbi:serine-rich adhesin for platelets-like isoform X2 [Ostrea edulis]|uniref:serine-rich adhesin for platelets-like isoform X2 n=1 Tax=Ostrea edulis TaxID=37623 RepID=UPI0024AF7291|nr:serine-rich adhesin for platelets-like isoform X2 [Ostrea edulis]